MITRQEALEAIQQLLLPQIARLYAIEPDDLKLYPTTMGVRTLSSSTEEMLLTMSSVFRFAMTARLIKSLQSLTSSRNLS